VIRQTTYRTEPWAVRERELDLERLAQAESVFALSNGHIGLRGNLDEGEPTGLPGTYLGGFWDTRPLPYAEAAYGDPEQGQTAVNVTNGKVIRLLVDDAPFDVRYGTLDSHERVLDLRSGTLQRELQWTTPAQRTVSVRSTRVVSLVQRSIAAIRYEVQAHDQPVQIVVQSELVANERLPDAGRDPRAQGAGQADLLAVDHDASDLRALLVHRTAGSKLYLAAAMDHALQAPSGALHDIEAAGDVARMTVSARLAPGESLVLVKFLAYGWSRERSEQALGDQVLAALTQAKATGWDGLLDQQRHYLEGFWGGADVELEGDPELQQAVRFGLFHVLQASARAERRAIAAKGLTGSGYDGHAFWDTESFVLPLLTHTLPQAAADALRWRHSTLERAGRRARKLGLAGAAFPWRTINGEESSGYWPAGTAAFHINADIAVAVERYTQATGDEPFEREVGLELLVQTARLWISLGQFDADGRFRIDGVTGPDEYSALADNNVYTNLMARRNLAAAAAVVARQPDAASTLGVAAQEPGRWLAAAGAMTIPFDERLGVHPQSEGFTDHARFDFAAAGPEDYPLMLHFPYFELYRKQVLKQADLVLAMHVCSDAFTPQQKLANFAYYEPLTVRDSSLSACTQAVIAAEVGYLELAHAYFREAALMDLDDLEHNVRDGLHIASLAGAWIAAVAGFGGMRDEGARLRFAPALPEEISRLRFRMRYRGSTLEVAISHRQVTYTLLDGPPVTLHHLDEQCRLSLGQPLTRPLAQLVKRSEAPHQPPGREPRHQG
jgi:alpha,alpha-trehalose phosphorylase